MRTIPTCPRWTALIPIILLLIACGKPDDVAPSHGDAPSPSGQASPELPAGYWLTPTPDISANDLQSILSFKIVLPSPPPDGLQMLDARPAFEAERDGVEMVWGRDGGFGAEITLQEGTRAYLESAVSAAPGMGQTTTQRLFGATSVTMRDTLGDACSHGSAYSWEVDDVIFIAEAWGGLPEDRDLLDRFVAATIGAPPAEPLPPFPATEKPTRSAYGDFCDLTLDQARSLAPFPLTIDDPPAPFELRRINLVELPSPVYEPSEASPVPDDPQQATFVYTVSDAPGSTRIELTQGSGVGLGRFPPIPISRSSMTIAGIEVERLEMEGTIYESPTPIFRGWYIWSAGSTNFILNATIPQRDADIVSIDDLETLIAAMIGAD